MSDELRWQFDLAWALAELHLSALVEDTSPRKRESPSGGRRR